MINKVDSSRICETHLPPARQRAELRYGLLLNLAIGVVLAVHADELLAAWVDPRGGSRVVVDKIGASFGGPALFPSWRKLTGAGLGSTRMHHGRVAVRGRIASSGAVRAARARALLLLLESGRACTGPILGQGSVLVSLAFNLSNGLSLVSGFRGAAGGRRAIPAGGASVMVNIICTAEIILPAFPTGRQTALGILKRAQLTSGAGLRAIDARRRGYGIDTGGMVGGEAGLRNKRVAVGTRHGRTRPVTGRSGQGRQVRGTGRTKGRSVG